MKDLKELVLIVNKYKLRSIELMGYPFDKDSKLSALYDGVLQGKFDTDEDAATYFYPSDANSGNYRKLKANLRNRLINTLFFVDVKQPSYNDYQRAYYSCYKDWAAIKILLGKNATQSAISLSQKVLQYAGKYEFTSLCMDICATLRLHYGTKKGNFKKFEEYNNLYKYYLKVYEQESMAEEYYTLLSMNYVNNKATQKALHKKAKDYYEEIEPGLLQYEAHQLQLYGYLIKLMISSTINDYEGSLKVCNQAIAFFRQKPYEAHVPLQIFFFQQMVCYIHLKQFDNGRKAMKACQPLLEEGSYNWFKYTEMYFILSMHTHNYTQALKLYHQTVNHTRFRFLPANVAEVWKIYEAYLYYLGAIGKATFSEEEMAEWGRRFRLNRFLNDTPIFSKDKRGMNISILIIQILILIHTRKYDEVLDRIEAIQQYSYRYLQQDTNVRSNTFIKMLLQIPAANFRRSAVVSRTTRYLKELSKKPLEVEVSNQSYELEIIPYEELWEMALESMNNASLQRLNAGSR